MLDCNYDWRNALDSNNTVDIVMTHFCRAFDVVLHKLTLGWLEAFLCGRSQVVNVNGATSSRSTVTSGMIQGSVIGPALFILYIHDLHFICAD